MGESFYIGQNIDFHDANDVVDIDCIFPRSHQHTNADLVEFLYNSSMRLTNSFSIFSV